MSFSWQFDAPTGTFRNHTLSNRLYENALENSVAMPFVDITSDFGKGRGDTYTLTRFGHITEPATSAVDELTALPEVAFTLSNTSISIVEHGISVGYTGRLETLSKYDIENAVQRTLMEQKRLVLDSLALTQFKSSNVKYVPTAATTSSITYNSTPSGQAVADLAYFHIEDISQNMYDDLRVPYFDGDMYIGIFRAKTVTSIRRDSQFISWNQFTNPGVKARGEVGTIERIRLIETNHAATNALPNVGTNSFGQGVVFGRDGVLMVEAETPHLRAAIPANFGRFKALAWYGQFGFGLQFPGATTQATSRGISRIVHVTSAAA